MRMTVHLRGHQLQDEVHHILSGSKANEAAIKQWRLDFREAAEKRIRVKDVKPVEWQT